MIPVLGDVKINAGRNKYRKLCLSDCFPAWCCQKGTVTSPCCCMGQLPQSEGLLILQLPMNTITLFSRELAATPGLSVQHRLCSAKFEAFHCKHLQKRMSQVINLWLRTPKALSFREWKNNHLKYSSATLWNEK